MKNILMLCCFLSFPLLLLAQTSPSKKEIVKKSRGVVTTYSFNFDCSAKDEKEVTWDDKYENNINEVRESVEGKLIIRPNPFLYQVYLDYELNQSKPVPVTFRVFDISGKLVATIFENQRHEIGAHEVIFDASELHSGTYFFELSFEGRRMIHKGIKIE